ncbi:MAG: NAD-dependent epimerase/dehydratase family protein [Candidatus Pelagibacter sp.]
MKYYKNKKIFIAGGSGLVGTNLLIRLLKINKNVKASYNSKIQNIELKKYYKKYDFRNFKNCLKATKNMDIVFILAVKASGILGLKKNFTDNISENFLIRSNLLKSCIDNNVKKILWVSSSTVYQPSKKKISENKLNLNIDPYNIYYGTGWLYRYLEKLCFLYNQNKQTDIKVIRTSSIYGPYDNFNEKKSHVIPALIKKAYNKKKVLEVWGNKKIIRDFVYVEDLVDAMLKFILKKKNILPINFSSGKAISIFRLAKKILEVSKSNKKIYFNHSERSSANYRVLDNKKINQIVKNLNRTKLEDGLKKTIEWYKKFNV